MTAGSKIGWMVALGAVLAGVCALLFVTTPEPGTTSAPSPVSASRAAEPTDIVPVAASNPVARESIDRPSAQAPTLAVRVLDFATKKPVSGMAIGLDVERDRAPRQMGSIEFVEYESDSIRESVATTDGDGVARSVASAGRKHCVVSLDPFRYFVESTVIEADRAESEIYTAKGGGLRGRVVSSGGDPVAGVDVRIYLGPMFGAPRFTDPSLPPSRDPSWRRTARTNATGEFGFDAMPVGIEESVDVERGGGCIAGAEFTLRDVETVLELEPIALVEPGRVVVRAKPERNRGSAAASLTALLFDASGDYTMLGSRTSRPAGASIPDRRREAESTGRSDCAGCSAVHASSRSSTPDTTR